MNLSPTGKHPGGRPSKSSMLTQREVLEAIRDKRTKELAARVFQISPTLLWQIAKGHKGIKAPLEELQSLDLLKWIPFPANKGKKKSPNPSPIGVS